MLQMTLMFLMFFNSFLFTQTNHPMSMGIILLFQTLTTCLMTGIMSKSFWFSYILFLVFIGGMLILFMYMSSLASNEKLNFSLSPLIKFLMILNLTIFFMIFTDKFYTLNYFMNEEMINYASPLINENSLSLSKMYNYPNNYTIILLVIYLLLTLVMAVKITNLFTGPLRPKFN
uniref:NADH dehydrogenase subunit 6 n=1 Tax=Forcipomyia pulchrithorax TaxID=3042879 RepID=UPI002A82C19D|nr:NADH dehydrogenase subunit 6 [Forcipomyia pulchrithorax]WOR86774.1 NADH dehydrogenase subunit 6 [Forcipomyia pulchrithorax]